MGIVNALNNRPVRTLGFITAIHSLVYGIGYYFEIGGFIGTLLFVSSLSAITTHIFGAVLMVTGAFLAFAFSRNNPKTIRYITVIQSMVWLYATVSYFFNGTFMLAFGISLPWVLISSYISYAHSKRTDIIAYDQTKKAKYDTAHEDQLWG